MISKLTRMAACQVNQEQIAADDLVQMFESGAIIGQLFASFYRIGFGFAGQIKLEGLVEGQLCEIEGHFARR